ncbi:MAG: hypothetical protein ACYTGN_03200 [Planctomycetota bacterium]|jgi:hypothetical protein
MKRQALETLRSAIEENTERKSLEDLAKQGKRHVRVVSSEKVMAIIKAVVADIVDKEVGELSERDRARIEQDTKREFDRVLKMQTEQDGLLRQQKEIADEYRGKAKRLAVSVEQAEQRIDELKQNLATREIELERLRGERDTLIQEVAKARENPEMTALGSELGQMRALLNALQQKAESQERALLAKLDEKSGADASALDEQFKGTLDAALDKISRTMEAATAKPVDVGAVEATNVLVDKLFDMEESSAETNLDDLDVEERSSSNSISRNLDRLKAMRAGKAPEDDETDEGESDEAAPEQARAIGSSVERLKAMRGGEDKEDTEE